MPKLPRVSARQITGALERAGFFLSRQSGSHMIYKNASGRRVTVLFHAQKTLHPKLLRSILREADIRPEDLVGLL